MKKRAFTLVEILIALFILAGGLVFLFNSFLLSWQSLAYSRKMNEVSLLAQKKLEELKANPSAELGETTGEEGDLRWTIKTQDLRLPAGFEVVFVQMDIEFDYQSKPQRERFVTYLTKVESSE